MLASLLSLTSGAADQGAATEALVAEQQPEPAAVDPPTRTQIARWIYEDKIEQAELDESRSSPSRASSSRDILVRSNQPPGKPLGPRERVAIENDPHYRHIPDWAVSNHTMPDNGTFPAAMIVGQGKCGTNVLAEALYRLNYNYPLTDYSIDAEEARQGWAGEVNWPYVGGCTAYETEESLAAYKQLFSPVGGFGYKWLDKSTANLPCAKEIATAFPKDVMFFSMMCDPVMALWSRMNHVREALGVNGSSPEELEYVLQKRLQSTSDCYTLTKSDKRLERQQELCYQLEGGLQLFEVIGQWKEHAGDRMKFLFAEESKRNASYLIVEAARHTGSAWPDNTNIGDVHTNIAEATYIEPEGPQWVYFVNRMRPVFRPLIKKIAETYPDEFREVEAQWSSVTSSASR